MNESDAGPTLLELARRIHRGELTVEEAVRIFARTKRIDAPEPAA